MHDACVLFKPAHILSQFYELLLWFLHARCMIWLPGKYIIGLGGRLHGAWCRHAVSNGLLIIWWLWQWWLRLCSLRWCITCWKGLPQPRSICNRAVTRPFCNLPTCRAVVFLPGRLGLVCRWLQINGVAMALQDDSNCGYPMPCMLRGLPSPSTVPVTYTNMQQNARMQLAPRHLSWGVAGRALLELGLKHAMQVAGAAYSAASW